MPCPDRSLCISSFDPVTLRFGGENPNEFRSAPGPTHREGCYNAWSASHSSRLHTWLSKLNLPPLQSWRCVRRLRQLCQCWAPSHFIPHIPSLQRKHTREPEGWSHAVGTRLRSDIWSARLLKIDKFTKCIIQQAWSRNCVQAPASNNLLLNPERWSLQQPVITSLKDPAERKTFGSQDAQDFWILLIGFVQYCPGFWISDTQLVFWFPLRVPCLIYKLQLEA